MSPRLAPHSEAADAEIAVELHRLGAGVQVEGATHDSGVEQRLAEAHREHTARGHIGGDELGARAAVDRLPPDGEVGGRFFQQSGAPSFRPVHDLPPRGRRVDRKPAGTPDRDRAQGYSAAADEPAAPDPKGHAEGLRGQRPRPRLLDAKPRDRDRRPEADVDVLDRRHETPLRGAPHDPGHDAPLGPARPEVRDARQESDESAAGHEEAPGGRVDGTRTAVA